MSDKLSFLGGDAPSEIEEPTVEVEAEPVASGPERGPDGKFAAKASPEPTEAETPPPPAPPLSEKETVGFYKAMAEERDKRQALERRLAELQARQEPAEPPPLEAVVEQRIYAQNLRASRRFAEREYGKDTIATVHEWAARRCDDDPLFNQHMRSSDDPYEAAYQAYNREQIVAEVSPGDLEGFRAWKAANGAVQAATPPAAAPAAPAPPKSLANASGTGAVGKDHVPVADGNAYAAAFPT